MQTLQGVQCPRCVLRFGFTSEMHHHLRMDHEPPREVATEVAEPAEPAPVATSAAPPATDSDLDERNRLVVRMIAAGAVVALIAAFSWQLAALLSIALVGIAAVRSSLGSRIERGAG